MTQDQNSEELEIAPQDVAHDDSQHDVNEVEEESPAQAEDDSQERNWRAMRQRQKELENDNKQKGEMLEQFMKMQQAQAPQQQQVIEEEPEIDDNDYIAAGGVKGIARKAVQPLEKKIHDLEAKLAQQEQTKLVDSLRTQFSDFDDVVNVGTLEILEKTEPELASTIAEFKDPYKMGIQSYKYIKALGLVDKLPDSRRKNEVDKKIKQNAKTVQSPMAYDKRPMAQAFKSTAADQKRLYEEMMMYAGQASGL